ncbi:MAG: minichromosome maintenance protein MCM [Conexivisphaerales archaeon]
MTSLSQAKVSEQLEFFLKSFQAPDGTPKYRTRISQMIAEGKASVLVDYEDLLAFDTDLAITFIQRPDSIFPAFREAAYEAVKTENLTYADDVRDALEVRIKGITDKLPLRAVAAKYLDRLVAINGMVVRTSEVQPLALVAAFRCPNGHITLVPQPGPLLKTPTKCGECEESRNLELDKAYSKFTDYQVIRIQELPEELPPGQLPTSIDAEIVGEIVSKARPGDRVVVTGVVRAEPETAIGRGKLTVFRTRLQTNYVDVSGKEADQIQINAEDEAEIKRIAALPDAYERLINSIAPSIYGFETQKEAVLLMITGAPQGVLPDGTTIRGDLNILMVGDPGTAKSELLKYVSRVSPRGLYTTGRGSTAAGLTAAVVKEKSGLMMLEAGAVVLADQGVACIDEFDKMRVEDRGVLHEVMEQQTVSVAKGGIVATLNARTSILAAANPVFGKYDPYKNIYENVNLPTPLLTRFDLVFIIRDIPDRAKDEKLASHILETHRAEAFVVQPPLNFDMLRKYLIYAKKVEPKLTKDVQERLLQFYLDLRGSSTEGTIAITPRQLEGMIRIATARARLLLRDKVIVEDALQAINLMRKMLESVGIDVKTGKVDLGVLQGRPASERTVLEKAMDVFRQLHGPDKKPVEAKAFVDELVKTGDFSSEEAKRVITTLYKLGQIYEIRSGYYSKIS